MNSCQHNECVSCTVLMRFSSEAASISAQNLLLSTVASTNAKYNCISCRMATNANDPTLIQYTEQWSSEMAFVGHARSGEFKRVLNAMDLCCEMPEVKVERLYTDSGIECFHRILQQAADAVHPNEEVLEERQSGTEH